MSDDAYRKAFDDGYSEGVDEGLRVSRESWTGALLACGFIGCMLGLLVGWWQWS